MGRRSAMQDRRETMYEKNLDKDIRLRLCEEDFAFLCDVAEINNISVSQVLRSMIKSYRNKMKGEAVQWQHKNQFQLYPTTQKSF